MTEATLIYTIGHSNRDADAFLAVLRAHGVTRLVDVRSMPRSHFEHFRREPLAQWLPAAGIEYIWMGDTLGGLRTGGYARWMGTPQFATGLARLEDLARERPTAFMCAERDPRQCHRRYIALALLDRGWAVRHLISLDESYPAGQEALQLPFDMG